MSDTKAVALFERVHADGRVDELCVFLKKNGSKDEFIELLDEIDEQGILTVLGEKDYVVWAPDDDELDWAEYYYNVEYVWRHEPSVGWSDENLHNIETQPISEMEEMVA